MKPVIEQLDIHSNFDVFEVYMEWFEIWTMIKEDVEDDNIVAQFLTIIEKIAYSLIKTLVFLQKPIPLSYAILKELLLYQDSV